MPNASDTAPFTLDDPSADHRWRDYAACRGLDTELFFPGQGESVAEAKAICSGCTVRVQCAAFALDSCQRFGIWGGASERERRRERGRQRTDASNLTEAVA